MKTFRTAAAATLLALSALAAPASAEELRDLEDPPGRSDDGGHPVVMTTSEQDCFEHVTGRLADWQEVADRLPAGWVPAVKNPGTGVNAGRFRAAATFNDFTCESWSIDGLPPRRTTVSFVVAPAVKADGSGERRVWSIEHGSDNPLFVERLRKLGVESRHLPRSTAVREVLEDGRVTYTQDYVDDHDAGRLTYRREGVVSPVDAPRTSVATAWFDGTRGPVSLTFDNAFTRRGTPTTTERLQSSVFGSTYRMPDAVAVAGNRGFTYLEGSWTGTLRLQPTAP